MNNTHIFFTHFSNKYDGNIAYHAQKTLDEADQNQKKLCLKIGIKQSDIISMNQTHGDNVVIVDHNSPKIIEDCDAVITNALDLPLMVMVADCIPILLSDPENGVIAAIHSGRNSTLLKILEKTILQMRDNFGTNPSSLQVKIGPHINKCCYEVSSEIACIVEKSFGKDSVENNHLDLLGINLAILQNFQVPKQNIHIDEDCTHCGSGDYFSFRKNNKTGRFCGIIIKKS